MKVDKKQLVKTLAICLLGLVLFAGAGVLLVFDIAEKTTPEEKLMYGAISVVLSLLCIVTACSFIYLYYQQNVKPKRYTDDPKSDYDIKREKDIHKKARKESAYGSGFFTVKETVHAYEQHHQIRDNISKLQRSEDTGLKQEKERY